MANPIDEEVDGRLNQCLVDVSYVCFPNGISFLGWAISWELRDIELHAHHGFTSLSLEDLSAFMVQTALLVFKRQAN